MVLKADCEKGQYVLYQGHMAKVVRLEPCSDDIYIEYNGKCYKVSKRDLVFDFSNNMLPNQDTFSKRVKDEVNAYCDKRIASSDAYIAEKEAENVELVKKIVECSKEENKFIQMMNAILLAFGVKDKDGISDYSKQREYSILDAQRARMRSSIMSADNIIFSNCNSILNECLSKHTWLNTKMVANTIANS